MAIDYSVLDDRPKLKKKVVGLDIPDDKSGPSLGDIGKGLAAELAIGESAKFAATSAGAAVGGPIGALVGYLAGAVGGGISGSLAAQRIEGRTDYSWGRVAADTLLNVIPFAGGKAAKTTKLFPKLGKRALTGAGISAGAAQIEAGIEEQRLLTPTELLIAGATGGALNIGIGAAGDALGDIYRKKISGKSVDEVQKAYDKGDADIIALVDAVTKGGDPNKKLNRFMGAVNSYVLPSNLLGKQDSAIIREAKNKAEAAMDLAGRARKQIDEVYNEVDDEGKKAIDRYILGETKELPENLSELKSTIDSARGKIGQYQDTVIDLHDRGILDMNELTYQKIVESRKRGDYLTTEYEFFLNKDYQPTQEQTDALLQRLTKDLEEDFRSRYKKANVNEKVDQLTPTFERRAALKIRKLQDLKDSPDAINDILKRKEIQSKEMQDYLGLVTDPGERFAGTIMKLGKMASTIDGNNKLAERFVSSGIGFVPNNEVELKRLTDSGYEQLAIKGKIQDTYGRKRVDVAVDKYQDTKTKEIFNTKEEALAEGVLPDDLINIKKESKPRGGSVVYVPKEINTAVDLLSRKNFKEDSKLWSENLFSQLLSTTTAMSKFVRVPLSVAAYPVQLFGNMAMTASMGMNPFKNYGKNFAVALSDLNTKNFREGKVAKELTLDRMTRLKELDLIDRGVSAGEIREGFQKGFLGEVFGKITEPIGKLYSVFDTAQRLTVFDNYNGLLKKVMPEEDFNKLGMDKIEEIAAELTNATYQNYGRINPAVRYFSRIGVLNEFAAFNLEQMRTLANQGVLIRDLGTGKFASDMKAQYNVDLDQNALTKEAGKRAAAGLAMLATASAGITAINRANGISKEDEDAIRETVAPYYNADNKLLIKRDGDKIKLANVSYQLPIAELTSVFEAGLRGENPVDAVGKSFGALWNKMGGAGTINATNFFAALNNRDPRTGRPISDEPGGINQFADRFMFYTGKTFTPTLLGKTQDKTMSDLVARYTVGLRNENTTIESGSGFKFRALKDNFNNIRRSYSSDLYRGEDMQRSYIAQNNVYRRNMEALIKQVDNLRTLGKTNDEITSILKKSGLSKQIISDAISREITDMPFAVGISGTRAQRKEKLTELYNSLPPDVGRYMLNEAKEDGKVTQSTINQIIRQSQLKKLYK